MQVQRINPESMPTPLANYCQVVRKGPIVTTAGVVAFDANGSIVGMGDMAAQTRQTLENMRLALEAVGASVADVVKTTIYITDFGNYKDMNPVFDEFFGDHPPARATVRADLVLPELLIEMDAMAVIDS